MFEDFYHLSGSPFQLNPDPNFYFASRGHSRALAYLKFGLHQGEGFIVITGEIGAGKTTLLRAMMKELDGRKIVAGQIFSTRLDAEDMLRAVATAFGLPPGDGSKADLLSRLEKFLTLLARADRRALLIVDEAQNLTPYALEELRMLSNFQPQHQTLLQSFLVGQPELRELLMSPSLKQLRQRVSASYHLGPMDPTETRAYVMHRLARVGWKDDPLLDEAIFAPLYEVSGGIPRIINAVTNRLLLVTYLAGKHQIGLTEFEETITELRNEVGVDSISTSAAVVSIESTSTSRESRRPERPAAVSARLDRIEKSLAMLVERLNKIDDPHTKARIGKSATTDASPKWGPRIVRR